jgi:Ser-tRNA(Ala) deacylase AlaX
MTAKIPFTHTRLLYLENMYQLTAQAHVEEINTTKTIIILDQTVFYPQGGGQPADKGFIKSGTGTFEVHSVYSQNGIVQHEGMFQSGYFAPGEIVNLEVQQDLRELHNRNHTSGHLIDYALLNLGYTLESAKAYHFPQGPYVEYVGTLDQQEREQLQAKLEESANNIIKQALAVRVYFLNNDPKKRVMAVTGYAPILCGGTHVHSTQDIKHITIRKIKNEKGNLRVSYAVD